LTAAKPEVEMSRIADRNEIPNANPMFLMPNLTELRATMPESHDTAIHVDGGKTESRIVFAIFIQTKLQKQITCLPG
jgi:hypothetical protein